MNAIEMQSSCNHNECNAIAFINRLRNLIETRLHTQKKEYVKYLIGALNFSRIYTVQLGCIDVTVSNATEIFIEM